MGLTPTADTSPLSPWHLGLMNPVMLPLNQDRVGCVREGMPKEHDVGGLCDEGGHMSHFFYSQHTCVFFPLSLSFNFKSQASESQNLVYRLGIPGGAFSLFGV